MPSLSDLVVRVGANITDFVEPLKTAGAELDKFGNSALGWGSKMAAGLGLVALGTAAFSAAEKFESASRSIANATGATGKELEALDNSFKKVYASSAASAEQISTALAAVTQRTGLTGTALEDLTQKMLKVAKVTGVDVATAVAGSEKLFAQWGIGIGQQSQNLNYLTTIAQKTGINFAALEGVLTESGPVLRQMGFDFKTSASLVGLLEKSGLDAGGVIGGLNVALRNFAKQGVKDPQAALAQLTDMIKNAGTAAEAAAIAVPYFGKQTTGIVDAIRSGAFNVGEFAAKMEKATAESETAAKKAPSWSKSWEMFQHSIEVALLPLGQPLLSALTGAVNGMKPLVGTLSDLAKGFTELPPEIKQFSEALLGVALLSGPLTKLWGVITGGLATVGPALAGFLSTAPYIALQVAVAQLTFALYDLDKARKRSAEADKDLFAAQEKLAQSLEKQGADLTYIRLQYGNTKDELAYRQALQRVAIALGENKEGGDKAAASAKAYADALELGAKRAAEYRQALASAQTTLGVTDQAQHIRDMVAALQLLMPEYQRGTISAQVYTDGLKALNAAQKAIGQDTSLQNALSTLGLKDAEADSKRLTDAFAVMAARFAEGKISAEQYHAALMVAFPTRPVEELDALLEIMDAQLQNITKDMLKLAPAIESLTGPAISMLPPTIKELADAFGRLGIQTQADLAKTADQAQRDYDVIRNSGIASAREILAAWVKMKESQILLAKDAGEEISDAEERQLAAAKARLGDMTSTTKRSVTQQISIWQEMGKNINHVFVNDMAGGLAQLAVEGGKFSDVWKKTLKDIETQIISGLVKGAFKSLGESISGVTSQMGALGKIMDKVFGVPGVPSIGKSDPGGLPGVNGLPGVDLAGAASGGLSAGMSSVTGIVGAVGSVVSAISGVISNFQFAHMETSLNAIEHNTRYAMMYVGEREDGGILGVNFRMLDALLYGTGVKCLESMRDSMNMIASSAAPGFKAMAVGGSSIASASIVVNMDLRGSTIGNERAANDLAEIITRKLQTVIGR